VHLRELDAHALQRIAESPKSGTIPEQTPVHHGEDAGCAGALGGRLVDDAILEPESREFEPDAVGDNGRNVLGPSENTHDVHVLIGAEDIGHMIEVADRSLAEDRAAPRGDRHDAITETLQGSGDTVTRACRIGRQSDNRDDPRGAQKPGDLLGTRIDEH
jgi:hypothetical protein